MINISQFNFYASVLSYCLHLLSFLKKNKITDEMAEWIKDYVKVKGHDVSSGKVIR